MLGQLKSWLWLDYVDRAAPGLVPDWRDTDASKPYRIA